MLSDPYRTLGLEPGATPAEIKRAYRRLAKAFHPDSAGPAALPRFLAIQQAYEDLTAGRTRIVRGGGRTSAPPPPPAEPWRADPDRARRAREAAQEAARRRAEGAHEEAHRSESAGSDAAGGRAGGAGGGGAGGGGARRGSSRSRTTRKATLGSTSYDEAREQADRTWGGASWYGETSGEYWTVNPREYADPRKHGPEYQARGRRPPTVPTGSAGGEDVAAAADSVDGRDATPPADRWTFERAASSGSGWTRAAGAQARTAGAADAGSLAGAAAQADQSPAASQDTAARPTGLRFDARAAAAVDFGTSVDVAGDPLRRLGLALVAWPPVAVIVATVIGSLTGCASYAASCTGTAPLLPWLGQAILLGTLLVAPGLARLLSMGTIAVLLALIPMTATLVALGANLDPMGRPTLLLFLLVAWLIGVGYGLASRLRSRPLS